MGEYIFGWCLLVFLVGATLSAMFMRQIRDWFRRRKANRIIKREVPPPDQFDDRLQKYLERNGNGR